MSLAVAADPRRLHAALEHAAHLLPAQGPIGTFIHHNTLHAFEALPFHAAVQEASEAFGAEGYLEEQQYRDYFRSGRIMAVDVRHALGHRPHRTWDAPFSVAELEHQVLLHGVQTGSAANIRWQLVELDAGRRLRGEVGPMAREAWLRASAAWLGNLLEPSLHVLARTVGAPLRDNFGISSVAEARAALAHDPEPLAVSALWTAINSLPFKGLGASDAIVTHRQRLLALTGEDTHALVHPALIRVLAAFFDQGMAAWSLPGRERGLYWAWRALMLDGARVTPAWMQGLAPWLRQAQAEGWDATETVARVLGELGVQDSEIEAYLGQTLQALPGWAGMTWRLEHRPDERGPLEAPVSLMDLVAVRLLLDKTAVGYLARKHFDFRSRLSELSAFLSQRASQAPEQDQAWRLFQVYQLLGVHGGQVRSWPWSTHQQVLAALDDFGPLARRRVWHEAFEHYHARQVLGALQSLPKSKPSARFAAIFCMDDREESLRRHLEEVDPTTVTYGAAGFFGLAMDFHGLDGETAPLCPVVVKPEHEVHEDVHIDDLALALARKERRGLWSQLRLRFHLSSRTLLGGAVLTPALTPLFVAVMVSRLLAPRAYQRLRDRLASKLFPAPRTRLLTVRRTDDALGPSGQRLGFSVEEQVQRVATVLENLGLLHFPKLVMLVGHGSTSVNNPHGSAYDCGACGGRDGGPNARLFAEMANAPEVRAGLAARGILISNETWFLGALHDTCTDALEIYDTDRVPESFASDLEVLREHLDQARARNAHERCRKFESAPLDLAPDDALAHVEARAADLSQARPELGHATNAAAIVGRRALTRGLFFDRRAFLISYDPEADATGAILERILAAVMPVGAGINLEYYFSRVDNQRYGCGSKLPHNLTGLIGVMEGHASDLRTGLPQQMIEIHEPVRLLVVVEAAEARLQKIVQQQPEIRQLVYNEWIRLALVHPQTGAVSIFRSGRFEPWNEPALPIPTASSSMAYYQGQRDFLPPARIVP